MLCMLKSLRVARAAEDVSTVTKSRLASSATGQARRPVSVLRSPRRPAWREGRGGRTLRLEYLGRYLHRSKRQMEKTTPAGLASVPGKPLGSDSSPDFHLISSRGMDGMDGMDGMECTALHLHPFDSTLPTYGTAECELYLRYVHVHVHSRPVSIYCICSGVLHGRLGRDTELCWDRRYSAFRPLMRFVEFCDGGSSSGMVGF